MPQQALAFLAGIILVQTCAELADVGRWLPVFICLALPGLCWRPRLFASLALGVLYAALRGSLLLQEQLDPALQGQDLMIAGAVVSIPQASAGRLQFDFAVEQPKTLRRLRLSWYDVEHGPRAGERWELMVRLRPRRGFSNPGGYDYEGELFRAGLSATGYVRNSPHNRLLQIDRWRYPVLRLRAAIATRLETLLDGSSARGVIAGLAVGATQDITPRQWQVFAATGITHLIAISGLHITMIAGLAMWLTAVGWKLGRATGLSSRFDVAAFAGVLVAVMYAFLAGLSVPTQRTLIMLVCTLAALWLRRALPPMHSLALALFAVLLLDPYAALAPGFWLSFVAVAALLFVLSERRMGLLRELWATQTVVTVALLPATLLLFGSVSLIAPFVNLIAIPVFSALLVPCILLGVALLAVLPWAGEQLLRLSAYGFEWFWPFLERAALLPGALLHWPKPGPIFAITLVATAAVVLLPLPCRLRLLGSLALVPLIVAPKPQLPSGGMQVDVLDVGQGLAVVVRTRSHALLYDAGPRFRNGRSAGELAVVPFLWNSGLRRLDLLVVSHVDSDHAGGVAAVEQAFEIDTARSGGRLPALKTVAAGCARGEAWIWDGVRFEFLHPAAGESWSDNNGSCVLGVKSRFGKLLLTGDVEQGAESHLGRLGRWPQSEVIVVPHHGSRSSSSSSLVGAVQAGIAVVSSGDGNRWGFPHREVIERWCGQGAQVIDTADWGAISIRFDAAGSFATPSAYRLAHRRYWHAKSPSAGKSLC